MEPHPIHVVVSDDLERSRLTVLFRLLLAIPHIVWLILWSIAAVIAAIVNWFATLFAGQSPLGLHSFLAAYVRYGTHVYAYVFLAASPFPGFTGEPGSYPVDVEIDPPAPQNRWVTGFRIFLAIPAIVLATTLASFPTTSGSWGSDDAEGGAGFYFDVFSVAATVAILAWFACLARGRMPRGFRDLLAYALRYGAQAEGYVFLLTDRYPDSDPAQPRASAPPPPAAIRLTVADDLRRSRLTVLFRLLLALPHIVWLLLWGIAAVVAVLLNWVVTLATGRSPAALHRFLSAYLRYTIHVQAFVFLVANPFPGFTGAAGSYPVDLGIDPPERQNRWVTGFRLFLGLPALIVTSALGGALFFVGIFGWFASLAMGRMPRGLRNLGAYVLRYTAQADGYALYLLTQRYPYSGPSEGPEPEPEIVEPEVAAA